MFRRAVRKTWLNTLQNGANLGSSTVRSTGESRQNVLVNTDLRQKSRRCEEIAGFRGSVRSPIPGTGRQSVAVDSAAVGRATGSAVVRRLALADADAVGDVVDRHLHAQDVHLVVAEPDRAVDVVQYVGVLQ